MNKLKIEYVDVDTLIPYVNNAKVHSDEQVTQIAASIKEFGFNNPVLIDDDGGIIAGHGRVMASKKLGLKQVPTVKLSHLTDLQRKAYILADNKLAENATWDDDLLKLEIETLKDDGFNLDLLGWNDDELNTILNGWDSDIPDISESDYDDSSVKLVYKVDSMDEEHAREVITNALDSAGIEYE